MDFAALADVIQVLNRIGKSSDSSNTATLFGKTARVDRTACAPFGQVATSVTPTIDNNYHTLASISGHGYLDQATLIPGNTNYPTYIRITVDGVVKFNGGSNCTQPAGVIIASLVAPGYSSGSDTTYAIVGSTLSAYGMIGGHLVKYPYTANATPGVNDFYLAVLTDSIYFTQSLLIEYSAPTASTPAFNFAYAGGNY